VTGTAGGAISRPDVEKVDSFSLQFKNVFTPNSMRVRNLWDRALSDGERGVRFLHIEHYPNPAYTVFEPKGGGGVTGMVGTNARRAMKG
jgi:hypothetical protein